MAAIAFTKDALTLTFSINPSFPRASAEPTPMLLADVAGDGTPHVEDKGELATLVLAWPETLPMSADDFFSGAAGQNLINFYRVVSGTVDEWTFTDHDASTHRARFMSAPDFRHVGKGFAGTLTVGLRT